MTPKQIIGAYRAIHELANLTLPYKASRGILKLKKAINEEFESVRNYESQIREKYGGTKERDGSFNFADPESAKAFVAEHEAFMADDDENVKLPVVDLSKYADQLRLSAATMEALEGLVIFEEGE